MTKSRRYKTVKEISEVDPGASYTADRQHILIKFGGELIAISHMAPGTAYDDRLFVGDIAEEKRQQILDMVTVVE